MNFKKYSSLIPERIGDAMGMGNLIGKKIGLANLKLVITALLLASTAIINLKGEQIRPKGDLPQLSFRNTTGNMVQLTTIPASAVKVTVGIYGINIYDLNLRSNTYSMSMYVWLRWKGTIDPVKTLEFTNVVDNWGLIQASQFDSAKVLPDGSFYQVIQVNGRFFQAFNLTRYPLDTQELTLYIENSTDTYDQVVYVPDRESIGYSSTILIPGWEIQGLNVNSYLHDYGTNFGEVGESDASKYSTLKFSFQLERYVNFFLWKMLLPLLIVLMTNWIALLLNPTFIEVRTAMPATALLTTVFMHQSALDAIPECPSLVLMDQIFVMAYAFIVITLIQIIYINTKIDRESPESIARMVRVDKWSFTLQITGFVLLLLTLTLG
jgi:hypothetical protein